MNVSTNLAEDSLNNAVSDCESEQFLTFSLLEDVYGININSIKEITEYSGVSYVPTMPDYIAGVINLRGSILPVINLASRFGKESSSITKKTSVIVLDVEHDNSTMSIGVIVDRVREVIDIPTEDIEPAPEFGARIRSDFIGGMGKVDGELLVILEVNCVLSIDELSVVSDEFAKN